LTKPSDAAPPEVAGEGPAAVRWERASCVVCGATTSRFFVTARSLLYERAGAARIVRCTECGHLYQDPRPTADTIAACYTADYGPHAESAAPQADITAEVAPASAQQPWYLSSLARRIPGLRASYYWLSDPHAAPVPQPPAPGAKALEFGCGSGRYLDQLQAAGWQVEGIEPADEPARRCRERGLAVTTGGIESAALQDRSYDLIVAWMVVEHLHDPAAVLRQIRTLLKPGGTFLFSIPNIACWETAAFGQYHYIFNEPTHLHHFSPRGIRRLLTQSGFEVRKLRFQHNLYNVVGSFGLWLRSRFPQHSLGARCLDFCDEPTMAGRLALAPLAKLLAATHQGGRLTILAQPSVDEPSTSHLR